ncbi:PREDICTED: translation machinery-associated protein 16-like [Amphimedon queenslandica]|uniref:Translation machinery-associated protein 16 n=1 Tax=Amphimedon queenslandica TaxID=400682 RepID=A0A1X7VV83_AMPQE|nr:PREDICTED: translation machinery-associated protein 16-like [Amphimedon queenslandica]|eukprot:XP_003382505.1 PREDICTED: translation machinery-associated protein 16-like [Amphimedon queenslandica]
MTKNKIKTTQKTANVLHPNSRKAARLTREAQRLIKIEKIKQRKENKTSTLVSKLMWFRNSLDETKSFYTREEVEELIELYLHRLDDELDSITERQERGCLSAHYRMQHASREDTIRLLITQEQHTFLTTGIEIPDLTNGKVYKTFLEWSGDASKISNLKMKKFKKIK